MHLPKKRPLELATTSAAVVAEMETEDAKAATAELEKVLGPRPASAVIHELAAKRGVKLDWAEAPRPDPNIHLFTMAAVWGGEAMGPARGRNKKAAKEAAARACLLQLHMRVWTW